MPSLACFGGPNGPENTRESNGELMGKTLILCDCSGTQRIDSDDLSRTTGLSCSKLHSGLCTTQSEEAAQAIAAGRPVRPLSFAGTTFVARPWSEEASGRVLENAFENPQHRQEQSHE